MYSLLLQIGVGLGTFIVTLILAKGVWCLDKWLSNQTKKAIKELGEFTVVGSWFWVANLLYILASILVTRWCKGEYAPLIIAVFLYGLIVAADMVSTHIFGIKKLEEAEKKILILLPMLVTSIALLIGSYIKNDLAMREYAIIDFVAFLGFVVGLEVLLRRKVDLRSVTIKICKKFFMPKVFVFTAVLILIIYVDYAVPNEFIPSIAIGFALGVIAICTWFVKCYKKKKV